MPVRDNPDWREIKARGDVSMSNKHPSPPEWAANLTQRLLAEAPESMAFWEIMATALANERSRCAGVVRDYPDVLSMWERPGGPPGNGGIRKATQNELADAILRGEE